MHRAENFGGVSMRDTFGIRLRIVRKQKGMTKAELSRKSGVSQSLLCHYEKEDYTPNLVTFEWICDALGVSATELLGF